MDREIAEMEKTVADWIKKNGYDKHLLPPEVDQLNRLFSASRFTLNRLNIRTKNDKF